MLLVAWKQSLKLLRICPSICFSLTLTIWNALKNRPCLIVYDRYGTHMRPCFIALCFLYLSSLISHYSVSFLSYSLDRHSSCYFHIRFSSLPYYALSFLHFFKPSTINCFPFPSLSSKTPTFFYDYVWSAVCVWPTVYRRWLWLAAEMVMAQKKK